MNYLRLGRMQGNKILLTFNERFNTKRSCSLTNATVPYPIALPASKE